MRGCRCGTPSIYSSKEEAETAGQGRLRFYLASQSTRNLRVLTVTDDKNWHCHCSAEYKPVYEPIIRKRKADDAEIRQIHQEIVQAEEAAAAHRARGERGHGDDEEDRPWIKRKRTQEVSLHFSVTPNDHLTHCGHLMR